jgi:hypothetical protein
MKFLSLVVLLSMCGNLAFADVGVVVNTNCDYTKIVKNADGTFTYTKQLHLCVGDMKLDLEVAKLQIVDLNQALSLKDVALQKSDSRVKLWSDTSEQLENRITKIDTETKRNDFLYFALGIAASIGVGFMTAKLIGR